MAKLSCASYTGVARSGTLADGSTVSDTTPRYGSLSSALWSLALSLSVTCGVSPLRKIYRPTLLTTPGYFRTARGKYMLWTAIGSLMMTLGFIVRIPMNNDPTSIPIYTVQTLVSRDPACPVNHRAYASQLILLSPCAFIAQDYYVLPHMASWLETNDCLYLRPAWIGRIFLTSDVITFLVQLGGSGMAASQSLAATGEKVSSHSANPNAVALLTFTDRTGRLDHPAHIICALHPSPASIRVPRVSFFKYSRNLR